jgi:hypothetical protein
MSTRLQPSRVGLAALLLAAAAGCGDNLAALDGVVDVDAGNDAPALDAAPAVRLIVGEVIGDASESGGTATFTVVLSDTPLADVTVPLTFDSPEVTLSTSALVFTAANALVPQTVTVTGVDDAIDDGDRLVAVEVSATTSADPRFDELAPTTVEVANLDDDTAGIVSTISVGLSSEGGLEAIVKVSLSSQPTADVVLDVASLDPSEGVASPAQLVFTAGDWALAQPVTLIGQDDDLADGDVAYVLDLAVAAGDAAYLALASTAVPLVNVDDDIAGVAVGAISNHTAEDGTVATYQVVLRSEPTADVTVTLGSDDPSEGVADSLSLTFSPATWDQPQTVTVTGQDDAIDDGDVGFEIDVTDVASADPNYAGVAVASVAVINDDDDTAGVTFGPVSGDTREDGGAASFTVALASQPTAPVTLTLGSADASEGQAGVAALVFDADTWNVAQTVTVTGQDDDVDDGDVAYAITFGATISDDATYAAITPGAVDLTNLDDDVAGVAVSAASGPTSEAGGTATFKVALTSEPTSDVRVNVAIPDASEGVLDLGTLDFSPGTWAVAQTVTVTGQDDDVDDGDVAYAAVFAASTTADPLYAAITPGAVALVNADDDTAAVLVSAASGHTSEAGDAATFSIVLGSEPLADVVIAIASEDPSEGVADVVEVTFTAADWDSAQAVTVTGQNDDIDDGDVAYVVTVGGSASADPAYAAIAAVDVALVNDDDADAAGVVITPAGTVSSEAGAALTVAVRLASEPTSDVVVELASDDPTEGVCDVASLTFSAVTWAVDQVATVTGQDDDVDDGDVAYQLDLAVASGPASYLALALPSVDLTNADDDAAGLVVSAISGHTSEAGASATFTVRLASEPTADVTLAVQSDDAGEGTPDLASLTFATAAWATPQTVTVTGVDDAVTDGAVAYHVKLGPATSADVGYAGQAASVDVVNDDNDCGFLEGFEGGALDPAWTVGSDGGGVSSLTAHSGSSSALVSAFSSQHQLGLRRTWAGCQPASVVAWVNPGVNATANYVVLGRLGGTAVTGNGVFMYVNGGQLRLVGSSGGGTFNVVTPNVWSKVEFRFNWATKTYDTYWNDVFIVTTGLRDSSITDLAQIDLYNFSTQPGRWDDISFQ